MLAVAADGHKKDSTWSEESASLTLFWYDRFSICWFGDCTALRFKLRDFSATHFNSRHAGTRRQLSVGFQLQLPQQFTSYELLRPHETSRNTATGEHTPPRQRGQAVLLLPLLRGPGWTLNSAVIWAWPRPSRCLEGRDLARPRRRTEIAEIRGGLQRSGNCAIWGGGRARSEQWNWRLQRGDLIPSETSLGPHEAPFHGLFITRRMTSRDHIEFRSVDSRRIETWLATGSVSVFTCSLFAVLQRQGALSSTQVRMFDLTPRRWCDIVSASMKSHNRKSVDRRRPREISY